MEDGRRLPADLVIAADGVHSRVRDSLGLVRRRQLAARRRHPGLIPRTEEERRSELGQKSIEYWSGRRRLFYSACSQEEVYLAFMLPVADREGSAVPVNQRGVDPLVPAPRGRDPARRRGGALGPLRAHRSPPLVEGPRGHRRGRRQRDVAQYRPGRGHRGDERAVARGLRLRGADASRRGCARWEAKERPLTEHTQMVAGLWGASRTWPALIRTPILKLRRAVEVADEPSPARGAPRAHRRRGVRPADDRQRDPAGAVPGALRLDTSPGACYSAQ